MVNECKETTPPNGVEYKYLIMSTYTQFLYQFVFATKNFEGMPEIANLCTPYTELTYSKDFEDKILSCLQDKK